MDILFVDGGSTSKKILRSPAFNVIKNYVTVVDIETNDEISPLTYNVYVYPTLVCGGSKYVSARAILKEFERMAGTGKKKPLF